MSWQLLCLEKSQSWPSEFTPVLCCQDVEVMEGAAAAATTCSRAGLVSERV